MAPPSLLVAGVGVHSAALALTACWIAWSLFRNGVRKVSLRRYTYYGLLALHVLRLAWLTQLLVGRPRAADSLDRAALCVGTATVSVIVFGWAGVACSSPTGRRPPGLLTAVVGVNVAHCALQVVAAPGMAQRVVTAAFAGFLALMAAVFGMVVSMRFVQLAAMAADPGVGDYVSLKFNKINVAWHALCLCFAARAAAVLPLESGTYDGSTALRFCLVYMVPDLTATIVGLVVLRKKPVVYCWPSAAAQRAAAGELRQHLIFSPATVSSGGPGDDGKSTVGSSAARSEPRGRPSLGSTPIKDTGLVQPGFSG